MTSPRRWCFTLRLGWFVSFLVLVVVLKLRMTPPRGDNWAGCVGLTVGLLIYCWRYDLYGLALAGLITGFIGGIGFGHAVFGRRHIAFAFRHIRFEPDATIHKEVTASGETWKSG